MENLERRPSRGIENETHALYAGDDAHLIQAAHDGRGAPGNGCLGKAIDGQFGDFRVDVRIDQPGHEEIPGGIADSRLRPHGICHIADGRNPTRSNGDIRRDHAMQDHVDQSAPADHHVGWPLTQGDADHLRVKRLHTAPPCTRRIGLITDRVACWTRPWSVIAYSGIAVIERKSRWKNGRCI